MDTITLDLEQEDAVNFMGVPVLGGMALPHWAYVEKRTQLVLLNVDRAHPMVRHLVRELRNHHKMHGHDVSPLLTVSVKED